MNDLELSDELRGFEVRRVILSPKQWLGLALPFAPLKWTVTQMSKTKADQIPNKKKGVYTFVVQPAIADHPLCAYLLYVGKAAGLEGFRSRYRKYIAERTATVSDRPRVNRMVRTWFENLWFCYAEVDDAHILATEDELLKAFLPPMNTEFPAEVSKAMRMF